MKDYKPGHKISTVGQDDFPEYEGRTIVFDNEFKVYSGLIVGFNRSVGVTIVDANDKDRYLFCYRGPVAPGHRKGREDRDHAVFEYCIKAVEQGVFNSVEFDGVVGRTSGSNLSAASCAYAQ